MDGLFIVAKRDSYVHPCGKHRQFELSFYNTLHIFFLFPRRRRILRIWRFSNQDTRRIQDTFQFI